MTIWWCETHESELRPNWETWCWKKADWVYLEGECRIVNMRLVPVRERAQGYQAWVCKG